MIKVGDVITFRGSEKTKYIVLELKLHLNNYCISRVKSAEPEHSMEYTGLWAMRTVTKVSQISKQEEVINKIKYLTSKFEERQKLATSLKQKRAQDAERGAVTDSETTWQGTVMSTPIALHADIENMVVSSRGLILNRAHVLIPLSPLEGGQLRWVNLQPGHNSGLNNMV